MLLELAERFVLAEAPIHYPNLLVVYRWARLAYAHVWRVTREPVEAPEESPLRSLYGDNPLWR